jgi:ATP-binding cassette, subfamily B, bacterial PglK
MSIAKGNARTFTDMDARANVGTGKLLQRIWAFLSRRRRRQIGLLLGFMVVGTFLDMASLAAVLPFLQVLMNPAVVMERPHLARLVSLFGVAEPSQLIATLTLTFIGVVLVAAVGRLGLMWVSGRMSAVIGSELSTEVYRRTLYQPFSVHVARNSSELIASITKKIHQTITTLQSILLAIAAAVMALGIVTALVLVDPAVALLAALMFGSAYLLVARFSRRRLIRNSQLIRDMGVRLVKALQEGLGGIRDVLLDGTQAEHTVAYRKIDRPLRRATATNGFITQSPKLVLEALGVISIAVLAYGLVSRGKNLSDYLPVLAVLALGAQRLLPAFQHMFAGYAGLAGHQASIAEILNLLEQPLPAHALEPAPAPLQFQREIRLEHVFFRYSEATGWVLQDVNLHIQKGARIGFVGRTGGGKSTAVDLLMGLLEPNQGQVVVDGEPISGPHGRAWQRAIAHVPQSIYLSDATIAENVAFGVRPAEIEMDRVKDAARTARIADFVETLPEGYETTVGERGVRLSGGQRQRIGIARALYKRASVLVFDEATSALDNTTEQELMDAIEGLSRDLTILMIAHRITTIRRCDSIIILDQGQIAAEGRYEELLQSSEIFQSLAAQRD